MRCPSARCIALMCWLALPVAAQTAADPEQQRRLAEQNL
jgi:hypothetical protein